MSATHPPNNLFLNSTKRAEGWGRGVQQSVHHSSLLYVPLPNLHECVPNNEVAGEIMMPAWCAPRGVVASLRCECLREVQASWHCVTHRPAPAYRSARPLPVIIYVTRSHNRGLQLLGPMRAIGSTSMLDPTTCIPFTSRNSDWVKQSVIKSKSYTTKQSEHSDSLLNAHSTAKDWRNLGEMKLNEPRRQKLSSVEALEQLAKKWGTTITVSPHLTALLQLTKTCVSFKTQVWFKYPVKLHFV